ncbi:MAG: NAD(P)/FAD-dependent oxidoreductase [Ilumatobacter sp.]|uniref:phytoene desaturase family protein n=1 Tax=Ilumatobacter sp. TaxID=1967498 RepID=UPI0026059378|nr:NAD(P)/FAD-dependent oxidoreductase [Ilumatobacter sp.]MDJ0767298.1 NAD(P)/FAD-dependent oxidoreductase [Ilumatobacter sp.]
MTDATVLVVGGGHNGLICGAYLARAGVDTVLVEARPDVGGCASTVHDLDARFNICNCDHTMVRGMPIIDELDLTAYGLRYLESEVSAVHQFHDGTEPWLFFHDVERHLDALHQTHPSQVAGYRRYLDDALPVARLALEMARTTPSTGRMLRRVAAHRAAGAARLLDWSRRSVIDVMAEYFDDWHLPLPGISTGPTVWGAPPTAPGTGTAAALYATRHLLKTGRPAGGSGALTDATRASFEAAGGRVRCDSRVSALMVSDGAVLGVQLESGERLTADVVVAACDPHRVFVDWIDDPPPAARRLVDDWRARPVQDGYESKIDAVLTRLPRFAVADRLDAVAPGADLLAPTSVISPSLEQLAEAHELRAAGRVAPAPTMLVNVPTVLDADMQVREGEHVLSLEVLFTPYALEGGWAGSSEPERWLAVLDTFYEPGTLEIDRWRAMTPDRYEREFSMHRGHTPSFAAAPLVTLLGRQRETTRHRTPIDGLYLSGAGTFPGAGVFGAPGRNAADAVLADLRRSGRPGSSIRRPGRRAS